MRSCEQRMCLTACFWPSVSPLAARPLSTAPSATVGAPSPIPARIHATTSLSPRRMRSVANDGSRRFFAATRWPSRTSPCTAALSAGSRNDPGECPSASVSSIRAVNTDRRSPSCSMPRHTISAAESAAPSTAVSWMRRRRRRMACAFLPGRPISRARTAHIAVIAARSGSSLRLRVASAACWRRDAVFATPCFCTHSRISRRRVEKLRSTGRP